MFHAREARPGRVAILLLIAAIPWLLLGSLRLASDTGSSIDPYWWEFGALIAPSFTMIAVACLVWLLLEHRAWIRSGRAH